METAPQNNQTCPPEKCDQNSNETTMNTHRFYRPGASKKLLVGGMALRWPEVAQEKPKMVQESLRFDKDFKALKGLVRNPQETADKNIGQDGPREPKMCLKAFGRLLKYL